MATLHIVNQAPTDGHALQQCLRAMTVDDGLLLIEDGVYAALAATQNDLPHERCHVLAPDLALRGLAERIDRQWSQVDYNGFVVLVTQFDRTVSWF